MRLPKILTATALTLGITAAMTASAGSAHADDYMYPCPGVVLQSGGNTSAMWYDQNGTWGYIPLGVQVISYCDW